MRGRNGHLSRKADDSAHLRAKPVNERSGNGCLQDSRRQTGGIRPYGHFKFRPITHQGRQPATASAAGGQAGELTAVKNQSRESV